MNVAITTLSKKGRRNVAFNKRKILECISKYEPEGISPTGIANEIGIHRSTTSRICEQLKDGDWIVRKNKQAKYHLGQRAKGDPWFKGYVFSREAISEIMNFSVSIQNKFCKIDYDSTSEEELSLFRFSVKLGALFTYVMIKAMCYDKPILEDKGFVTEIEPEGKDKSKVIVAKINNAINSFWILWEFSKLGIVRKGLSPSTHVPINKSLPTAVRKKLYEIQGQVKQSNPNNRSWSPLEIDRKSCQTLLEAYAKTFPDIYKVLEKIKN